MDHLLVVLTIPKDLAVANMHGLQFGLLLVELRLC